MMRARTAASGPRLATGSTAPIRTSSLSYSTRARQQDAQRKLQLVDATATSRAPALFDSFGRRHDYLRISLTEKCNLRCTYCMPSTGVPLLPREEILTTDEIARLAKLFVEHGVTKIRLTGGEPTVRRDLVDVVSRISALSPAVQSLGITSNGVTLRRHLPALVDAGLTHLNLSLDTLDEFKYELMTRRRGFNKVMESLQVAKSLRDSHGLKVKLNMVVIKGLNDMEVQDFVQLTKDEDITVRFIEYMPFEDNRWSTDKLVPSALLLSQLSRRYAAIDKISDAPSDTTRAYRIKDYKGTFGFISSMTNHFCGSCSRLRIAADGGMKVCLFGPPALALRPLLRSLPATPENDLYLSRKIGETLWGKKFAHNGLGGMYRAWSPRTGATAGTQFMTFAGPARAISPRVSVGQPSRPRKNKRLDSPMWISAAFRHDASNSDRSRLFSTQATQGCSSMPAPALSHIDPDTGKASMVDVSSKEITVRTATAKGKIFLNEAAYSLIDFGTEDAPSRPTMRTKKGDVLSVAQIAGMMAAKQTSTLIPLCHPLPLSHISVHLTPSDADHSIEITCSARCQGQTGVEMEALTAVSIAGLTVWDMCKAVAGQEMRLGEIRVVAKSGGRSGDWTRSNE